MKKTAIYIHIPFCDHKCIYCDFYSLISYENKENYLAAIKKEIEYYANHYSNDRIISTIFLGGGTPSFMEPEYIASIIKYIKDNFTLSQSAEITLETNPGTVSKDKLSEFYRVGINRLSIGIQSFDNDELKFLTRIHDKNTAIETVESAANAGFKNISIDLIFSLPKQSFKTWQNNLKQAMVLPINHISTYSLILENGTILNKLVIDGKVKMNSDNHDADLYKYTMDYLEKHGFNQYEISNFSKKGYECLHNVYYWDYEDYLSFGTAAHSFINGKRWWNYSSLKKYINDIEENEHAMRGSEELTKSQMFDEYIMLALRSKGINIEKVKKITQDWFSKNEIVLSDLIKDGYLKSNGDYLACTKKGYMVCDEIINKLL